MDSSDRSHPLLFRLSSLIFALAAGLRVALLFITGRNVNVPHYEAYRVAESLLLTGVFGNPFAIPTGATAHTTPIPVFLQAGVQWILGLGPGSDVAWQIIVILTVALLYALLPWAALRLGWNIETGLLAALLGALLPVKFANEIRSFGSIMVALALVILLPATVRVWKTGHISASLRQGLAWGVAILSLPPLSISFAALHGVGWIRSRRDFRFGYAKYVLSLSVLVMLVSLPWVIRNYIVFGALIPLRDNFGLELWLANRPGAGPWINDNLPVHPLNNMAEAEQVRDQGELAYNREKLDRAMAWIRANPADFARLTLLRFRYFWFPPHGLAVHLILWPLVVLAWLGLVRLWRDDPASALAFTTLWVSFPLIYYLVQGDLRYRYPIDWSILLVAMYAVGGNLTLRRFDRYRTAAASSKLTGGL